MIELYYRPTPDGHKITVFLEQNGPTYRIASAHGGASIPVDLAGKDYSIAGNDAYCWIVPWQLQAPDLTQFPANIVRTDGSKHALD